MSIEEKFERELQASANCSIGHVLAPIGSDQCIQEQTEALLLNLWIKYLDGWETIMLLEDYLKFSEIGPGASSGLNETATADGCSFDFRPSVMHRRPTSTACNLYDRLTKEKRLCLHVSN